MNRRHRLDAWRHLSSSMQIGWQQQNRKTNENLIFREAAPARGYIEPNPRGAGEKRQPKFEDIKEHLDMYQTNYEEKEKQIKGIEFELLSKEEDDGLEQTLIDLDK